MPRIIILWLFGGLVGVDWIGAQPCEPFWSGEFSIGPQRDVMALAEFDEDGPGPRRPALIVGGDFTALADGTPILRLARYDGQAWTQIGPGIGTPTNSQHVFALAVFDEDGDGPNPPRLMVGGHIRFPPIGIHVPLRWDGTAFSRIGSNVTGIVSAMQVWDEDGPGPIPPALYAIGDLDLNYLRAHGVLKWDGVNWSLLPFPATWVDQTASFYVGGMVGFDPDGDGPLPEQLHLGAAIYDAGSGRGGVARWTGSTWEFLGDGLGFSQDFQFPILSKLIVLDEDGDGPSPPALFAGGAFAVPGEAGQRQVARWDGSSWHSIASFGNASVWSLAAFDPDGDGPEPARLYATGGDVGFVRRWDGQAWTDVAELAGSIGGEVSGGYALLATQRHGAPALYVGGTFTSVNGMPAFDVARLIGCPHPCPADLTGDGIVDLDDLGTLLAHFGAGQDATPEQGDLNEDGDIDLRDLTELLAAFSVPCS